MNQDEKWQKLLSRSASTFAGDATLPYGFATAALAGVKAEKRQQEEAESIGWRALVAAFATLVVAAVVTISVNLSETRGSDFDPGVRGVVQMETIQLS